MAKVLLMPRMSRSTFQPAVIRATDPICTDLRFTGGAIHPIINNSRTALQYQTGIVTWRLILGRRDLPAEQRLHCLPAYANVPGTNQLPHATPCHVTRILTVPRAVQACRLRGTWASLHALEILHRLSSMHSRAMKPLTLDLLRWSSSVGTP